MKDKRKATLDKAVGYGLSIRGADYGWWRGGAIPAGAPAYAALGTPPDPATVRANGVFCAGVCNLMRRSVGLAPPIRKDGSGGRGGTGAYIGFWWKGEWYPGVFFDVAEPILDRKAYPEGTLLARVYRSVEDQGHVQVLIGGGRILESTSKGYPSGKPGCISSNTIQNVKRNNYMQYAVLPFREDGRGWLQR